MEFLRVDAYNNDERRHSEGYDWRILYTGGK
jgi:hypothetical protein